MFICFQGLLILFSSVSFAEDFSDINDDGFVESNTIKNESNSYLKINKDGIKLFVFNQKKSDFRSFRAVTHINASLDSILAVMLDNKSCVFWIDACKESILLKKVSFNERYHYQMISVPFPFTNRDFIFHSIMKNNHKNKSVTISMSSNENFCLVNKSKKCKKINEARLVRVNKSIASFKLESDYKGTKITWMQYTDPAGNLPSWLINNMIKNVPYYTFKNLSIIVKKDEYRDAKLIYDDDGKVISLINPYKKQKKMTSIVNL